MVGCGPAVPFLHQRHEDPSCSDRLVWVLWLTSSPLDKNVRTGRAGLILDLRRHLPSPRGSGPTTSPFQQPTAWRPQEPALVFSGAPPRHPTGSTRVDGKSPLWTSGWRLPHRRTSLVLTALLLALLTGTSGLYSEGQCASRRCFPEMIPKPPVRLGRRSRPNVGSRRDAVRRGRDA